jgi:hypothetical protein
MVVGWVVTLVTGLGGTEREEKGGFGEKPTDNRRTKRPKNKKEVVGLEKRNRSGWME